LAEHGIGESIAAGLATCLAFLGTLGAALKFWNWDREPKGPEKGEDMGALLQRMSEMERRQGEADRRMDDVFDLLTDAQKSLASCEANTREALTRLDERRRK